ncbi:germ line transcription factor 1 [Nasonia vitripennis]|uniref:Replication factor C subunit 1 n=1 Tax=Nasonia vitripennis TaxID=7425 RepID=A0A7M6ULC2_NASVI|nr:germ line transcription factor 1 [Nasonia vitripennis]
MSKDIRSFFITSKGSSQTKSVKEDKSRKKHVISSDEDEEKNSSPSKSRKTKTAGNKNADVNGKKGHSKKRTIVSSDEEDNVDSHVKTKKAKVLNGSKIETVEKKLEVVEDVGSMFSKKPAKRINAPKITKKNNVEKPVKSDNKVISSFIEDDDFDATLNQLDTSHIEDEYLATVTTETSSPFFKNKKENDTELRNSKKEEKNDCKAEGSVKEEKSKDKDASNKNKHSTDRKTSPGDKNKTKEKNNSETKHNKEKSSNSDSETKHKNDKDKSSKSDSENKHKNEKDKSEEVNYNDIIEEKIEKKKQHVMLYQNYLNRGGARNPGSKEIPEGAEQCLANLSFLITGVLDSLERGEAEELITKYGGRMLHSVSKKLNYIIIGEEAGPSKLAKAESLNIKKISEDGLLELIRTRPAGASASKKPVNDADGSHKRKRDDSSNREANENSDKAKKNKHESPPKDNHRNPEEANKNKDHPSPKEEHKSLEKTEKKKDSSSPKKDRNSPEKSIEKNLPPKVEKVESKSDIPQAKNSKSDLKKIDITGDALVEKYRPKELKQIIGQTGDKSNAKKLHFWLTNWHKNHGKDAKGAKPKFSYKDDTGTIYKAALLSGPPGIGKTTTAYVVCAQLGYEVLEFNASDTRSKKLLQEEIAGILSNKTVKSFLTNGQEKKKNPPKHVLLMDEVDGMAGNEDRGGMQELIAFIKSTEVPIICICNDRMSQKIKTLANYTFDLRFQKPRLEQIRAAMMSMCYKEGITVTAPELTAIIQSTNQDIRQVINHVAMLSAKSQTEKESHEKTKYKNLKLGPWDVVRKVFSADEHKNMSIHDKSDLFFHDYNIAGLFVEENYLSVTPSGPRNELFDKLAKCSDSLAIGDTIENAIRGKQAWGLLPVQACFSSVIPGSVMSGFINSQINFPSWLGRNSKRSKCDRLLQDITVHARITTGASKEAINLDYLKMLVDSIVRPLAVEGTEGVEKAVEIMNKYHLSREDLDSLIELTKWPHTRDPMQSVDSKTKAAFTKAYNKSASFHSATTMKKKSSQAAEDDEFMGSDEEPPSDADADNDKIENDKLIKAKTSKAKTSKPAPSDSKGKGKAKGAAKSSSTRGKKK